MKKITLLLLVIAGLALSCDETITENNPTSLYDVEILHPAKGETLIAGREDSILWSNPKTIERHSLYYSLNNGKDWTSVSTNSTDQSGKFIWNVPDTFTDSAKIRILATSEKQEIYIESDSVFSILLHLEAIEILHPTTEDKLIAGGVDSILWSSPQSIESYSLYYSLNNGNDWTTISSNNSDQSGKYIWNVPYTLSEKAKIRMLLASDNKEIYIESDSVFQIIVVDAIQIIEPCDSAVFKDPASIKIGWSTLIPFDRFEIYYSKYSDTIITYGYPDNKREYSSEWILLSDNLPGSVSEYIWEEPYLYSNKVKIKIIGFADGNKSEVMSKKIFTVRVNEILTEERKYQEKLAVGNRWKYKISYDNFAYDSTYYVIKDAVGTFLDGGIKYYEIEQMKITDTVTYSLIQLKDREHYSPSYILQNNDVFSTHFYSGGNGNWGIYHYHSESRNDLSEEIFAETQLVKEDYTSDSGSGTSSKRIKRAKDFGVYYNKSGGEGYYTITTLVGALIDGVVYGDTSVTGL